MNSVYSSFFHSQYCSHKGSLSICRSQSTQGETPPILLEAVKHAWQWRNISASESRSHTTAPTGGAANGTTNKPIRLYFDLSMPGLSFFKVTCISIQAVSLDVITIFKSNSVLHYRSFGGRQSFKFSLIRVSIDEMSARQEEAMH